MNMEKKFWRRKSGEGHRRGYWWGLILVVIGDFWLLGNMDIVPEPARIVLLSLVIIWGIATLFTRQPSE